MIALVFLVVVAVLFTTGMVIRHRRGGSADSAFRTALIILSSGAGTAIVGGFLPFYVVLMRGARGGSIESNLPPGVSEDVLLNLVIIGAAITVVMAVNRYLDHLDS